MKRAKILFISLFVVFAVWSCASKPLPPPEMSYDDNAIKIHAKADPQLNLKGGKPHTLMVCVYQLKDPNAFNQFADNEDGLYELLECKLFDASVAATKRLIVQPGTESIFNLDRAQGVKHVGVVAGYYALDKSRMVRLYDIPVVIEKKGLIKKTKTQKMGVLEVELRLGPQQID